MTNRESPTHTRTSRLQQTNIIPSKTFQLLLQVPSSANNKAARAARKVNNTVPRAAAEDTAEEDAADVAAADAPEEEEAPRASKDIVPSESGFWKKIFLKDGEEEVSSEDYQKFQAELAAQKATAKVFEYPWQKSKAGDKAACVIM